MTAQNKSTKPKGYTADKDLILSSDSLSMIEKKTTVYESSVLIGAIYRDQPAEKVEEYLDELEFLTYTAGGEVKKRFVQRIDLPNPKTYLGSGKIEEIAQFV